jgi:hypothetical protein
MDTIKDNMINIYYKNLEIQAKKNKIDINLPKYVEVLSSKEEFKKDIEPLTPTENCTETETLYSEDFVYKKPWNKLNIIHKSLKIQEFVNHLTIDDPEMKKHLKNQLVLMIKNKKLTKKSDVEYDYVNGKVISIPSLQYKNNNYNIDV